MKSTDRGSVAAGVLAAIVVLLLIVGIAVGGYKLNWWIAKDVTNRQTGIANDSLARQQSLLDESVDTLAEIRAIDAQIATIHNDAQATATLGAQRAALVTKFCKAAGGFTSRLTIPGSVSEFASEEC